MRKILYVLFLAAAVFAIFEYMFVCGMFTGPIAMLLVLITGTANTASAGREGEGRMALLFAIATVALCMGYWKLMF